MHLFESVNLYADNKLLPTFYITLKMGQGYEVWQLDIILLEALIIIYWECFFVTHLQIFYF